MKALIVSAMLLMAVSTAQADIVYTTPGFQANGSIGRVGIITAGTITTDGAIGVLQPSDILSWQFTSITGQFGQLFPPVTNTGTLTNFTPGSVTATADSLVYDNLGGNNFLSIGDIGISSCPVAQLGCERFSVAGVSQFGHFGSPLTFASNNDVPVPGPILGAGLPGLIAACGFLAWRRRKQNR